MLFEAFLTTSLQAAPAVPPARLPATCPPDMQLVRGTHYEQVQRVCTDLRGTHCFAFLPGLVMREPRVTPIEVCVDRYEWPNRRGNEPLVMVRFVEAEQLCASRGKRLCTEFEWELACEGPYTLPFSYGFAKQPGTCNVEELWRPYHRAELESPDEEVRDREVVRLYQGVPSGARSDCRSPFGVHDLVGNVEEWVQTSRPEWPYRSSLKGGYWNKAWAGCRGTNERHGPRFRFYNIGFRCCAEPTR